MEAVGERLEGYPVRLDPGPVREVGRGAAVVGTMTADIRGVRFVKGRPYARVKVEGRSLSVPLSAVGTDGAALRERRQVLYDQVRRIQAAGRLDMVEGLAQGIGSATTPAELRAALGAVDIVCEEAARLQPGQTTVRDVGDRWVSGELARRYPDHIRVKRSASRDRQLLATYILPVLGDMPIEAVKLADCERVMRRIPKFNPHSKVEKPLSVAQRRHVAQCMHRLLEMCAYPMQLIERSPLPRGFLPKLSTGKAKNYLYPDEDAKLMACTKVPLMYRLFYGMLAREGMRFGEARGLGWSDLDIERGALRLDKNKTDEPRAWALDVGVVRALTKWAPLSGGSGGPFLSVIDDGKQAARFRDHLKVAGVDRSELHEATDERTKMRVHDLRATFVTLSLASGKTEMWVADRTGHKSSAMIARYRRAARTLAELNVGALRPLDEVVVWSESSDGG